MKKPVSFARVFVVAFAFLMAFGFMTSNLVSCMECRSRGGVWISDQFQCIQAVPLP